MLITGASSGIGRATALELLGAGYTVYGGARRVEGLDAVAARRRPRPGDGRHQRRGPPARRAHRPRRAGQDRRPGQQRRSSGSTAPPRTSPSTGPATSLRSTCSARPASSSWSFPTCAGSARARSSTSPPWAGRSRFPLGAWYRASKRPGGLLRPPSAGRSDSSRPRRPRPARPHQDRVRRRHRQRESEALRPRPLPRPRRGAGHQHRGAREHGKTSDPSVVAATIRKAVPARSPATPSATWRGPCSPSTGSCRPACSTGSPPARSLSRRAARRPPLTRQTAPDAVDRPGRSGHGGDRGDQVPVLPRCS